MPNVQGDLFKPEIYFTDSAGRTKSVHGHVGQSLMEVAKQNGIDGIIGECGGCCACATCHVLIDAEWWERVGPASADEADMLDFATGRSANSRLGCQIRLRPDLDGLKVAVPEGS